jgi:protein-S-isoprenylcysteine O-methyltransferase Ste14
MSEKILLFANPFFWAFVGMFGLLVGIALVSGIKLGQNALIGFITIMVCDSSRIILVLPFCLQPRFEMGGWNWVIGGIILAAALAFGVPALSINWRTAPDDKMVLKTNGIYGVVRNPIYLADILFTLGFAVMFRSIIGVALVPVWWAAFLALVLVEETSLERTLGQRYLNYKQQVKGRIIPRLPIKHSA